MRKIVKNEQVARDEIKAGHARKIVRHDDRMNLAKDIMDQYDDALKELAKK